MKDIGYSGLYILEIKQMGEWIISQCSTENRSDYTTIESTLVSMWANRHTVTNKLRAMRVIQRYDLAGAIPDGKRHHGKPSRYDRLGDDFRHVVDTACSAISGNGRRVDAIRIALSSFFHDLQSAGVCTLQEVSHEAVMKVFSPKGMPTKGQSFKRTVEQGLRLCIPVYGEEPVRRIINSLPCIPYRRGNIQFLTPDELAAIKEVVANDTSVSLQDKAIMTIAIYTGMRGCDICGLTMTSIDWVGDRIRIIQAKTGRPLELPLRAVVGNAIYDYIVRERPDTGLPYLFLTVNHPYRRLHTSNLDAICKTVMRKAGVRTGANDRKGMHLFRHNVATALLGNGVTQPVISSTLGHASPRSLDHYLDAHLPKLKECGLSIAEYPVGKEVFGQ